MNDKKFGWIREDIDTSAIEERLPVRLRKMIDKLRLADIRGDKEAWESANCNLAVYLKIYYTDSRELSYDEWKTLHDKYRLLIYLD